MRDAEKSGSNSLSIASVWESNEGRYHQVINGTTNPQTLEPTKLRIGS